MSRDPGDVSAETRKARVIAVTIAVVAIFWVVLQWVGAQLGVPGKYAVLLDLCALAGFAWALVNGFWLWRKRQDP